MVTLQMNLPEVEPVKLKPDHRMKLFSGRANPELAYEISQYIGIPLSPIEVKNFSDGEIYVRVGESIRGKDIFLIQPTCDPVNKNIMELLIMIDAFKRASAESITAVVPYYGYARQDRKTAGREAISAKLVADLISTVGPTRILAMDLHTGQLQGFFNNMLVDHIFATPTLISYIKSKNLKDIVIVSPDAGGVERARVFAKKLDVPMAIIDKRRSGHNVAEVTSVIGDVENKVAIIVDDIIDTAGTMCEGARLLLKHKAKSIYACAVHPILSGPALERLHSSSIEEIICTNTIPLKKDAEVEANITQLSIAPLIGEAIKRIYDDSSVSTMFQ